MGEKFGTEREVKAIIHNIKEQRVLEKSLGTLDLEESYSVKLLNLDYKTVKLRQRRLKNKVNKIKSHLTADEIADLKLKGIDEQIAKEEKMSQSGGAVRIAAAAKRLKLGLVPRNIRRALRPTSSVGAGTSSEQVLEDEEETGPWGSRICPSGSDISSTRTGRTIRPATSVGMAPRAVSARTKPAPRPKTAFDKIESKTTDIDDILRGKQNSAAQRCRSALPSTTRRMSTYSTSSFGEDLRKTKAQEKRQELLEEIAVRQEDARERCEEFMQKADRWVRDNPSISYFERPEVRNERGDQSARLFKSAGEEKLETERLQRRQDHQPIDNEAAWKDLNKCRYLRTDPDKIDLSGVKTLAIEQLDMFKAFKNPMKGSLTARFEV